MSDDKESKPNDNPKRSRKRRRRGRRGTRNNPMKTWAKIALGFGATLSTVAIVGAVYSKVTAKKHRLSCGEKYKYLVVTPSGYTFEEPGSTLPFVGQSMYQEWYALAQDLALQAYQRFAELGKIECEATGGADCRTDESSGGSYPRWNALVPLNNAMHAKLEDLSTPVLVVQYGVARSQAQSVIRDALCLLEEADEGIAYYGGSEPITPGLEVGTPTWKWVALGGGTLLALGGVAYGLSRTSSGGSSRSDMERRSARAERPREGSLTGTGA